VIELLKSTDRDDRAFICANGSKIEGKSRT